jgi:DNA polymerase elongation subunit (family B)
MNYVTFDIETYSPSKSEKINTEEFRCSVCGAYFSWIDEYVVFFEDQIGDFINLLKKVDLVIGYNHVGFDLLVLQKYAKYNLLDLPNYDIMQAVYEQIGTRLKLNDLCRANFKGDLKTDTYDQYKNYYWDKEWFKLTDYCMNDVRLTENLFRKIQSDKKLNYYNLHILSEVNLSEPKSHKKLIVEDEAETIW